MLLIPVFGKGMVKLMSLHVNRQRRTLIKSEPVASRTHRLLLIIALPEQIQVRLSL